MREAGFTLIELLVTLLVAGLLLLLLPMAVNRDDGGMTVERAASDVANALRRTRARAIAENQPAAFTLDLRGRTYEADRTQRVALPSELDVTLRAATSEVLESGTGRIRFFPDGSSTGGRITIMGGASESHVDVDWLTGRVAVER